MALARYRLVPAVLINGLHGTADAPNVIEAAPGEDVEIDGTVDVTTPWTYSASACENGCANPSQLTIAECE